MGLVYLESKQSFAYHMWTEVHVDGRWIPLDATLAAGGIGAAHLKLTHSNLKGASAFSSLIPVLNVIGRLKIEVLQQEYPDYRSSGNRPRSRNVSIASS